MRKLFVMFLVLGVLLVAVMPAAAQAPTEKPVKIYLVAHAACSFDSFWCVVEQGIKDAQRDLNVDVTLITPDKFDIEQTAQDIDRALAANPDGLGVTVTDGVLFEEPLMRAINAGIPVIAYNTADARPAGERIPYLTYIGQDEYLGGYRAGKRLFDAHGGKKGVCANQQIGHVGLDARCAGFNDALKEVGLSSETLSISDDPAKSTQVMGDYFTANPDADLWLTLGPNGANPFYTFMENAGLKKGDIFHGTFDLGPEIAAKIEEGVTDFAIDQQPYLQGYMVVQWLAWINRLGLYPAADITYTGPGFIDQTNLPIVQELAGTYR